MLCAKKVVNVILSTHKYIVNDTAKAQKSHRHGNMNIERPKTSKLINFNQVDKNLVICGQFGVFGGPQGGKTRMRACALID